jgi:pimeloyl-ACP methyl ester carboxylesterase
MEDHLPTVVLIHGASPTRPDSPAVISELETAGATTVAPTNPLRWLALDADYIKAFVAAIDGPVVLVGHSYGGAVITQASVELPNVSA